MNLFEIFNTRPEVSFTSSGDEVTASFLLRGDRYEVRFKLLNLVNFQLPEKSFLTFKDKICVSIIFGNIDYGQLNLKATNKNKAFSALSCVKYIVETWISKYKPDIIIFAAKTGDGSFESRSSLYSITTQIAAGQLGYSLFELSDKNGKYFIVSKHSLSPSEVKMIKAEVISNKSLFGKMK